MRRIVPNIYSNDLEKSKGFYFDFLDMELAMDMSWVLTFVSKENPTAQISIEVSHIDDYYKKARQQKIAIEYPISNEDWGVRRFFVKDPNGVTINLLSHLE